MDYKYDFDGDKIFQIEYAFQDSNRLFHPDYVGESLPKNENMFFFLYNSNVSKKNVML